MMDSMIIKRNSSLKKLSIWLPLLPFLIFALLFEVIPVVSVLLSSLRNDFFWLTLENYRRAMTPLIMRSFSNTIRLSATTAAIGVVLGTLISHALVNTRNKHTHNSVMALADVATNFGGLFNISLYPDFRIYSITGLTLAYLYFQIPLMILLIQPSILGLKSDWKEAASTLGASNWQYWKRIALPILTPSLIGGFLLLFAHSFGAYATAWTLTGPDINLVTIQIAALIRGEVQLEPGIADAMAIMSLLIMMLCVAGYQWASTRAAKWRS
jgi:putative spermidine/putrescine transport system permease protein